MTQKNKKSLVKKPFLQRKINFKLVGLTSLIFILGLASVAKLMPKHEYTTIDIAKKNAAEASLKQIIDNIKLDNYLVHERIVDERCNTDGSLMLQMRINCNMRAYKIYGSTGDRNTDLHNLDEELTGLGFARSESDFNHLFQPEIKRINLPYASPSVSATLTYHEEGKVKDFNLLKMIEDGSIRKQLQGEHYFGIIVEKNYYSCSNHCRYIEGYMDY
jgi:hypothetical protein